MTNISLKNDGGFSLALRLNGSLAQRLKQLSLVQMCRQDKIKPSHWCATNTETSQVYPGTKPNIRMTAGNPEIRRIFTHVHISGFSPMDICHPDIGVSFLVSRRRKHLGEKQMVSNIGNTHIMFFFLFHNKNLKCEKIKYKTNPLWIIE